MNILIFGAGMMGKAIAYDLSHYSDFDAITIVDRDAKAVAMIDQFISDPRIKPLNIDVTKTEKIKKILMDHNIAVSALPYMFNYRLAKISIMTKTHFLDLGGNNDIVKKEIALSKKAENKNVIVIPDCGLAPGLTSVITRDIVEKMEYVDYVKIRVGGLPLYPKPPLNYQIVFSPYGLINEYVEDAIVLDHGRILRKKSLTELETIRFSRPFGKMEAFLTSGGCSTLPYIYKDKIGYLDYKTIRYPGHCEKFKLLVDLGLTKKEKINIKGKPIAPMDFLAKILLENLPRNEPDVVLLKVLGEGVLNGEKHKVEYTMIDYYDEKNKTTAMMRTTGYPTSIIAQMIEKEDIVDRGVLTPEKVVPPDIMFEELKRRGIVIKRKINGLGGI